MGRMRTVRDGGGLRGAGEDWETRRRTEEDGGLRGTEQDGGELGGTKED